MARDDIPGVVVAAFSKDMSRRLLWDMAELEKTPAVFLADLWLAVRMPSVIDQDFLQREVNPS